MKINEIENYLARKNINLSQNVYDEIEMQRTNAIKEKNEPLANYCWCLRTIFSIQRTFILAFNEMKTGKYEAAWNNLDSADILLSSLSQNFDLSVENDRYHLEFISRIIKEYQSIYPYQFFFSRECVIKSEECSICGKKVSLRKPCGHRIGKIYMGEQCTHIVTDLDFKGVALVNEPFDKYAYVKLDGKEYNYGMVEMLISELNNPYDKFWIEVQMVKKPEFKNIGRNDSCPCGSGVKYKKCHLGKEDELMEHHIIHYDKPTTGINGVQYFGTWKE